MKKNKEGKEKSRSEKAREKKKEKASNEDTEVPYPVVPSKKDKDRHLARFLDIFRKLYAFWGSFATNATLLEIFERYVDKEKQIHPPGE